MATIIRNGFSLVRKSIFPSSARAIATTKQLNIKEIREQKDGSKLVIEGVTLPSPRAELLVRAEKLTPSAIASEESDVTKPCYLCALELDVKHTDVLILSQFVRSDGCMLPRRVTGLCRRQQKKIGKMVSMAQKAGLMINLTPAYCKKDPRKRKDYKKFNTYFDEKTIFMKRIPDQNDRFKR
ncbi:unnamed protein product [Chilo suppressalis]|uniref:28S ribosomal protein S18a, mitochondrial n=1 Tax=Chilo suppressalis TaxID=168631 RepID=A0ABN8AWF5_CHISP|nr:unnamed protein product [Chilo suppressalis]